MAEPDTYYDSYARLQGVFVAVESNPWHERFATALEGVPQEHIGLMAARYAAGMTGICFEDETRSNEDVNALPVSEFVRFMIEPEAGEKIAASPFGRAIILEFARRSQRAWEASGGQ